jgi:hypothetical protein
MEPQPDVRVAQHQEAAPARLGQIPVLLFVRGLFFLVVVVSIVVGCAHVASGADPAVAPSDSPRLAEAEAPATDKPAKPKKKTKRARAERKPATDSTASADTAQPASPAAPPAPDAPAALPPAAHITDADFAATPLTDADLASPQQGAAPANAKAPAAAADGGATELPPPAAAADVPANEGEATIDVTNGGVLLGYDKTLDSDQIRKNWAARGGNISGYEVTAGATFMSYSGTGMSMTGTGFGIGLRLLNTAFEPPSYERQDTSWTAFRFGIGLDTSRVNVTVAGSGFSTTLSQQSMTGSLVLGVSSALGSFTSPTDWSGVLVGIDWTPSVTQTNTGSFNAGGFTVPASSSRSNNPKAFAINIESGSLQALTESLATEAHLKVRVFFLPPVGNAPRLVTISVGLVDY